MIDLRTLKKLIKLMKDNELSELEVRDEAEHVVLRRPGGGPVQYQATPAVPAQSPAQAPPAQAPAAEEQGEDESNLVELPSPMVGTFYAAPSPDSETFVRVGSKVEPEDVVCVIEAMKVFNEIKAENRGTIEKVLVRNGDPVEYGQALFLIRPQ